MSTIVSFNFILFFVLYCLNSDILTAKTIASVNREVNEIFTFFLQVNQ